MRVSDLLLSNQDLKEDKAKEVKVYRIILLLCASFTVLLRFLLLQFHPAAFDPFVVRLLFSLMLVVIFLFTFFNTLKTKILFFNYLVFVLYTIYGLVLIAKNKFEVSYILEFVILIIIICLAFRDRKLVVAYLAFVFTIYTGVSVYFLDTLFEVLLNISLLGIFCAAILVFLNLRIQTEGTLRIREELLNTVFNGSPDALFLVDPSTSLITNCNARALSIFDYQNQENIIGNNLNLIFKLPYSPGSWNNLKKKVGQKRFMVQELEFKKSGGRFFWGSQAITEIVVGDSVLWLVRVSDITERVKDKKTIEENRKMLRQVVDLVPHQIFLKDHNGKFILVNKAVADKYSTTTEDMLGKKDSDFSTPEEARRFMEDDREVIEKGKEKIIPEEYLTDFTGDNRILQTTKIPFYSDEESKPGVLGIAIDITERVRDKQTIEEKTKILGQIIDLVPHLIYLKDSQRRFLLVNQALADLFQCSKEDLLGKRDEDLFTAEEAEIFRSIEEEVIRKGRTKFIPEETFKDQDGSQRIVNSIKIPFYLNDKNEMGLLGVNIDITEEKMAERALKESESRYRMVMEQASDGIYLCDQEGKLLDANVKAAEMFGYSLEEFLHINIKDIIDPDGISDAYFHIPDKRDRQSIIVERRFLKKTGTPITVELSARLLEDGRHQAIIRDITERKKLEQSLKDNEKKFRALIENSSDIIMILSADFELKFVSPSVKRIVGFDPEKILGKFIFEFVPSEDIDIMTKFLMDIKMESEETHTLETIRITTQHNEMVFIEIVAMNLLKDPVIQGIIINCHDITKRKKTESELLNTNFELDSFVYKASHDLKAPLRSVMGLIKLAKIESKDERQHQYLDMMNKSVISLDQFIKDLTQFSRNSRMEIQAKEIVFEEIINESLDNLKFMEHVDQVEIRKNIQVDGKFYSDLTRLSTVFNNLISNAYKYHRFENNNPYISIRILANRQRAIIDVEDNGQGIDPLHVSRVFEMFYRASESSYGSGLGLYIVKNAIHKLNGSIHVESIVNQGSKFIVVIPNLIYKVDQNEGDR